jgi:hypothetical protein
MLDEVELFDTRSDISYNATDVVLATTNCPVMFPCPTKVGENSYIDGALGGNSALPESVARLKEIKPTSKYVCIYITPQDLRSIISFPFSYKE